MGCKKQKSLVHGRSLSQDGLETGVTVVFAPEGIYADLLRMHITRTTQEFVQE